MEKKKKNRPIILRSKGRSEAAYPVRESHLMYSDYVQLIFKAVANSMAKATSLPPALD